MPRLDISLQVNFQEQTLESTHWCITAAKDIQNDDVPVFIILSTFYLFLKCCHSIQRRIELSSHETKWVKIN